MISTRALGDAVGSSPMSTVASIVFIVDDDISVRESLELEYRSSIPRGNRSPIPFAFAQEFLDHPRVALPRADARRSST